MGAFAVVGTQWGDEGKGKITDYYASEADYVVRFQGGNNAGHTIVTGGRTFKFHLLPSGIIHPDKTVVLGNGMVIDPSILHREIMDLEKSGMDHATIRISDRASVIMPYHRVQDALEEAMRGSHRIGTTRRGIGPAYSDKATRIGIRMGDLLHPDRFRTVLERALRFKKAVFEGIKDSAISAGDITEEEIYEALDIERITEEFNTYREFFSEMITDTTSILHAAYSDGKSILLEGAQGTLLDIDHGTYPYVTSSNTIAAAAASGSGLGPRYIDSIIGIVKAYTTRVGDGPFPTEIHDGNGDVLQREGHEFGTTTGRKRRCGWLDLVMLKYAQRVNSLTHIAITKLGVLGHMDEIKVAVAYEIDGRRIDVPPSDPQVLERVEPVYRTFASWGDVDYSEIVSSGVDAMPPEMREYVDFIASEMGVEIDILSFGPEREMTLDLRTRG